MNRQNQQTTPSIQPETVEDALADESPATPDETRAYLLTRSRRQHVPIPKVFVQNPDQSLRERAGPLSDFVRNGDLRGLRALLFCHAIISSGDNGWDCTLPLAVWARVFDTTLTADARSASTAASKVLTRLEKRKLISRQRSGRARQVTVTLLRPDGSGGAYTRPGKANEDRFLKLTHRFWTDGLYRKLDLPATAMLLVALHEKPSFELPAEQMPQWYGFSADTAERGLRKLRSEGFIHTRTRIKKAPLSPTGATAVNVYTLLDPFAQPAPGKPSTASSSPDPHPPTETDASSSRRRLTRKKRST